MGLDGRLVIGEAEIASDCVIGIAQRCLKRRRMSDEHAELLRAPRRWAILHGWATELRGEFATYASFLDTVLALRELLLRLLV